MSEEGDAKAWGGFGPFLEQMLVEWASLGEPILGPHPLGYGNASPASGQKGYIEQASEIFQEKESRWRAK
jgi:hypothetical protein